MILEMRHQAIKTIEPRKVTILKHLKSSPVLQGVCVVQCLDVCEEMSCMMLVFCFFYHAIVCFFSNILLAP